MQITLNGTKIECDDGKTILQAALENNIKIPTLCYSPRLEVKSRCRICIVEANGKLVTACSTKVQQGMNIQVDSKRAIEARKINTELMLVDHPKLDAETRHDLLELASDLGIKKVRFKTPRSKYYVDENSIIVRDENRCVMCGRCVEACSQLESVNAIDFSYRGYPAMINAGYERSLDKTVCVNCGQCIHECPVNAIWEKNSLPDVERALRSSKYVVVQTAPSVRVALGEEFGLYENVSGKMVAALKRIGFKKVFDTNLGADITIMEESGELIERIKKKEHLPLMTSCCPAWVKFMEHFYPELLPYLAKTDSPQECLGHVIKTYFAQKINKKPKDIIVVSVMPCTSKKFEINLPEINRYMRNVDIVITTRELAKLIFKRRIDFQNLPDEKFDEPLGIASGGGAIFGATGGVMEAALRNTAKMIGYDQIIFEETRGLNTLKEGVANFGSTKVRYAVIHGLANTRPILDKLRDTGECEYDAIEVMACPGGCLGGGGQPKNVSSDILKQRSALIYGIDYKSNHKRSMDNPIIQTLYQNFFKQPMSKRAKKFMQRTYVKRGTCNL